METECGNDDTGTAKPGRMESECGNIDEGMSGKLQKYRTKGDYVISRAEPTMMGKAKQGIMGLSVEMLMGRQVESNLLAMSELKT